MGNHVPQSIFILLLIVAILSLGLVGYGAGIGKDRNLLPTLISVILIASVILLIMDLDRPRWRLITVSQWSMMDLRETLNRTASRRNTFISFWVVRNSREMGKKRWAGRLFLTMIALNLWGCRSSPTPFPLDIPPLVTVPIQYAQIEDGRGRFREIYCAIQRDHGARVPNDRDCEDIILRLGGEPSPTGKPVDLQDARLSLQIFLVPGLFGECFSALSQVFSYSIKHIQSLGYKVDTIRVSGRHGSVHNALQIREALLAKEKETEGKVVLIGYSKGAADILEALVEYPEIQEKVAAVVSVAGVIGGTPTAEIISKPLQLLFEHFPLPGCERGDGLALQSLTRTQRQGWLARHPLPKSIRYFSIGAITDREGTSAILRSGYDDLAIVDPRNDSQVIFSDTIIPGGTLLGFVKGDHWAIAMPFSYDLPLIAATLIDRNQFPREILLEAVVRFVEERLLAEMGKSRTDSSRP